MRYIDYMQLNPFQKFGYSFTKFFKALPCNIAKFFKFIGLSIVKFFVAIGKGFAYPAPRKAGYRRTDG